MWVLTVEQAHVEFGADLGVGQTAGNSGEHLTLASGDLWHRGAVLVCGDRAARRSPRSDDA